MIDPQHECWWTRKRLTEIALASSGLRGAGVSLNVLLHAFPGQELAWYSCTYGEHDDNILLVAVDSVTAQSLDRLPPVRPATGAIGDRLRIEEYALSDPVAARLEISFGGNSYSIGRSDLIQYQLYVHDDCFFAAEPVDTALLERLLHSILRQHSFYLGFPVDWSGVLGPISGLLYRTEAVRMRSDRGRNSVTLSWQAAASSFWGRVWRRIPSHEIRIQDGRAYLAGGNEIGG